MNTGRELIRMARRKNSEYRFTPAAWQRDPMELKTDRVQVWRNGVMLGLIPLESARQMVKEGEAFVSTCQTIVVWTEGSV